MKPRDLLATIENTSDFTQLDYSVYKQLNQIVNSDNKISINDKIRIDSIYLKVFFAALKNLRSETSIDIKKLNELYNDQYAIRLLQNDEILKTEFDHIKEVIQFEMDSSSSVSAPSTPSTPRTTATTSISSTGPQLSIKVTYILNEIYTTEKTFRDAMKDFCDQINVIIKSIPDENDRATLQTLLLPFEQLINNPLNAKFSSLTVEEKIKAITSAFNVDFFSNQQNAFLESIQNMNQINICLDMMKAKYAGIDFTLKNERGLSKEAYTIMSTQRVPRYVLLFDVLKNELQTSQDFHNKAQQLYTNAMNFADTINQTTERKLDKENIMLGKVIGNLLTSLIQAQNTTPDKYQELLNQAINDISKILPNAANLTELTQEIVKIKTTIGKLYEEIGSPKFLKNIKDEFNQEKLVKKVYKETAKEKGIASTPQVISKLLGIKPRSRAASATSTSDSSPNPSPGSTLMGSRNSSPGSSQAGSLNSSQSLMGSQKSLSIFAKGDSDQESQNSDQKDTEQKEQKVKGHTVKPPNVREKEAQSKTKRPK